MAKGSTSLVTGDVPETKRRTLEEMQNLWTRGSAPTAAAALKQPAAG
jgi:hypothetical protein